MTTSISVKDAAGSTQTVNTLPPLGNQADTASLPVTLSSTQIGTAGTPSAAVQSIQGVASGTPVPVSQTTAPLPTNAATATNQASEITELTAIAASTAASATATNQATIITDIASIASTQTSQTTILTSMAASLSSTVATSANQTTAQTSLTAIQTSAAASATATNQASQLTQETAIAGAAGTTADTQATNATSSWSLVALLKGLFTSLASIITNTTPISFGQKTSANSLSIATASDDANLGPSVTVAGNTITGVNQDVIPSQLVSGMSSVALQLTSAGTSCVISFFVSNDNTNWFAHSLQRTDITTAANVATTQNAAGVSAGPLLGYKYFKATCTTYGSGSPTGIAQFTPKPTPTPFSYPQSIILSTATNLGPANPGHLIAAATTNATSVKTSSTVVVSLVAGNSNITTGYYLKVFNKASAPTVGTDVPVQTFYLPPKMPSQPLLIPATGVRLSTGFAFCIVAGTGLDTDTTAVTTAGDVVVSYNY